ncbi:DUF1775 domain-containing protein [Streptomyces sp. AC555_RSS877]|uniref:DUF1775 domain-containing protein n=1 Tax=Streptomyces sp. AC555_RSS877 TaxID=2823688 RepID=UPI001C269F6F|nr:DUF1775 domain-containing protein [Streptomyces sp. AC555_RSS877]
MPLTRVHARTAVIAAALITAVVTAAGPASAHVEVEAEGARALDQNVTLTFVAESESATAGITKLEAILPNGITPADVTYDEGPKGWEFATTDRGYAVSGPAITAGQDAEYAVTVRQLPNTKSLAFKTLQSYSDGRVDRWIELEQSDDGGHSDSAAPILELAAAAPGAETVSPSPTTQPTASASAPTSSAPSQPADPTPSQSGAGTAAEDTDDDGMSLALPIGLGVAALALAGGGVWWFRRRNSPSA